MADDLTAVAGGGRHDEELEQLEHELGQLARELTEDDVRLEAPPIDLWSAIEAEVDSGPPRLQPLGESSRARLRTSRIGTPRGFGGSPVASVPARPAPPRARTGLYGLPAVLGVAAVLALVLATGAALIVRTTNSDEVLAEAAIGNDGLPVEIDGSGVAVLKQQGDDQFLELELPELDASDPDSIYEVWMIDTDVVGMISLGNLTATDGETVRIDLPGSIDHSAFPVIDISVEPLDGDPTHSGQSVLRGVLSDVADA